MPWCKSTNKYLTLDEIEVDIKLIVFFIKYT